MNKKVVTVILFTVLCSAASLAQNNYMDNALNYNRLLREKTGDGVYKVIGTYKVTGTSFLFGEKNKGDLFSPDAKAYNISLSYNTWNQEVEFFSTANADKALVKEPGTVDSFIIHTNATVGITAPLKFIYGPLLGSGEESYFLELYAGPRYSVYKRYKSDLGYVSSNYIQSELRQFDLLYDYFYVDAEKKTIKKLKTNSANIIKEFKNVKDISPVFTNEEFSVNQEVALRKAFEYLNY